MKPSLTPSAIAAALLCGSISVFAAEPAGVPNVNVYGEAALLLEYEDRASRTGHIRIPLLGDAMDAYLAGKSGFKDRSGFNYIVETAPQFQADLDGDANHTANNETNLIVQWALLDREDPQAGNILFWYQWSDTWGSQNTSGFAAGLSALSPPNGGDTAPGKSRNLAQHLAWEQRLGEHWRIQAGKLTTRVLFNLNRYTVSDREDFFTPMLVNNPVAHYTARVGAGFFAEYSADRWYASAMIRDADADLATKLIDFDSLDSGNWELVTEFALTPSDLFGLGPGNYRFTLSRSDATASAAETRSVALSFDQDLGEHFGAFFRFSRADDTFRTFEQRLGAGFQWRAPLGYANDRLGIGFWRGEPTDRALDVEYGIDAFWKLQVSPWLEISPGLQVHMNPVLQPQRNRAWVGQVRLRMVL